MNRRWFGGVIASYLTNVSFGVLAQPATRTRRIGWLWSGPAASDWIETHGMNLRGLGWTEGHNLVVERRYTNGDAGLLPGLAAELVRLKVALIVAEGTVAAIATKNVTSDIPIIVARSGDPVGAGLVASLARPGANVTGTSVVSPDLDLKRFQVLHEMLPAARRVGELRASANPIDRVEADQRTGSPLGSLGIQLVTVNVAQPDDLENAIAEAARRGAQALHVNSEPLFYDNLSQILRAAKTHSLPVLVDNTWALEEGALVSYGPDLHELDRQLAYLIDKVLRGAKPSDLPIQQPQRFELAINLKAAKAMGITVPQSLLLRADKVVEK
jgi:putative ABC transport system substrate-binding protein